jgi:dienelactone hydrolase
MKLFWCLAVAIACIVPNDSFAKKAAFLKFNTPFPGSALYVPNDDLPHTGLVMLHGSEGGSLPYAELEAQFLAAHGYAVMSYCWYNCLQDPITSPFEPLENVELRKAIDAIEWLKKSKHVQGGKVGLLGWSRGGELAVVLGSVESAVKLVDAIAVHTPSDTVVSGFSWAGLDKRCYICRSLDLACFRSSDDPGHWDWPNMHWNMACGPRPKMPSDTQSWLLDGVPMKVGAPIEIEKFKKPVFITVGDKDELWDYRKSVRIKERLERFLQPVELHVFPGAGHNFLPSNENKRHQLLIDFLERAL